MLAALGIAAAVLVGLVLFVFLPVLAIVKATPEVRRMMGPRVEDPPISLLRVIDRRLIEKPLSDKLPADLHRTKAERDDRPPR